MRDSSHTVWCAVEQKDNQSLLPVTVKQLNEAEHKSDKFRIDGKDVNQVNETMPPLPIRSRLMLAVHACGRSRWWASSFKCSRRTRSLATSWMTVSAACLPVASLRGGVSTLTIRRSVTPLPGTGRIQVRTYVDNDDPTASQRETIKYSTPGPGPQLLVLVPCSEC